MDAPWCQSEAAANRGGKLQFLSLKVEQLVFNDSYHFLNPINSELSNCLQDGKVKKKKKEKKSKKKKEKKKSKKEKKTAEEDGSSDGSEVDLYTNPNPLPPHHHHLPNFIFSSFSFFFSVSQGSEDEWVEAQPQPQARKPWQVSSDSKPSEDNLSSNQNVQV